MCARRLVHPHEFYAHSASGIGIADDGAGAHFSFFSHDEHLNVSSRSRRIARFDVESSHSQRFGAVRVPAPGPLPGDEDSLLQLLARVSPRSCALLTHSQGRIPLWGRLSRGLLSLFSR